MLATDLRAILLLVFAAGLLYLLPAGQVARVPGSASQFFSGWAAYTLAGAAAALLAALFTSGGSLLAAFETTGTGAGLRLLRRLDHRAGQPGRPGLTRCQAGPRPGPRPRPGPGRGPA